VDTFVKAMEDEYRDTVRALHFFDSNCWLGRVNNRGPVYMNTVSDLIQHMDFSGIEKSLVSHVLARYSHPTLGNDLLLREIAEHSRLYGCFILLPSATDELGLLGEYTDYMLENNVLAVRLFPDSQRFSVEDWSADSLFGILQEKRIPLFIWSREITWDLLYKICKKYSKLPVIVEQCEEETYRNLRYLYPLLEKCQNLWMEVHNSHLYLQVDDIVKRFGAERLIFSTYYPVDDPQTSLMLITHGDFSPVEKELIAHGNLEKLMDGVQR
jgi:hypothetical protein